MIRGIPLYLSSISQPRKSDKISRSYSFSSSAKPKWVSTLFSLMELGSTGIKTASFGSEILRQSLDGYRQTRNLFSAVQPLFTVKMASLQTNPLLQYFDLVQLILRPPDGARERSDSLVSAQPYGRQIQESSKTAGSAVSSESSHSCAKSGSGH